MARKRIQLVDDEQEILNLLEFSSIREGYDVITAQCAEEALSQLSSSSPELILLDLMLPGLSGLELIDKLKRVPRTRDIPIIVLSARSSETDIVRGLESGADDYIAKPFSPSVLQARVRAVLRGKYKETNGDGQLLQVHELSIDPRRHEVYVNNEPVKLTLTEFAIVRHLARTPGWVFTRSQILDALHGSDYAVTDRSVDVQILGLRRKLGVAGKYIETVRGVGYRLKN